MLRRDPLVIGASLIALLLAAVLAVLSFMGANKEHETGVFVLIATIVVSLYLVSK